MMNNLIELLAPARRYLKKIRYKKLKQLFVENIEKVKEDPTIGQMKTGDLNGVYVHGSHYNKTEYRIAYLIKVNDDGTLTTVILIGEHENFYDELKNYVRKHLGGNKNV